MRLKSLIIPIIFLNMGIAIGWMLHGRMSGLPEPNATAPAGRHLVSARPRGIDGRPDPATGMNGAQLSTKGKSPSETSTSDHGGEEKGTVRVPVSLIETLSRENGVRRLDQELFSRDGRVEDALGITDHEKARIQSVWQETRRESRELEARLSRSEVIDEWSVLVTVPPDSSGLASLGSGFRTKVMQVLGGNRGVAFLALKQVDGIFSPPEGDRSYTITTETTGDGRWRYRMTLEGTDGNRVWVGETIPDELRHPGNVAGVAPSLEPGG